MVSIYLTKSLREVLEFNNIDPDTDYAPAYNGESAGLDLYNCGDTVTISSASYRNVTIDSYYNDKKFKSLIPTGLRVIIPKGYVGLIQERGSITKSPLKVRAGVIDSGYTGEIFVNCVNVGKEHFNIHPGNKLPFQLVVVKCDNEFKVIDEEEYLNTSSTSNRKEGKVGSSD